MTNIGEIHIIIGCMFSGKTSKLLSIIDKFTLLNLNIFAINHVFDTRYGKNKIITHNKREYDCIQSESLMKLIETEDYKASDIIVIEEAHFFNDLYEFVILSCKNNKKVYITGLSGDFKLEPIGEILKLIPHCDTIEKLSALCLQCNDGSPAYFSKRIIQNTDQFLVGSEDVYIPVCRKHYHSTN